MISFPGYELMASVWAILTATRRHIGKDNLSALAGGAAFQALLTLFPALTAVVSVYGLVADPNMVERQITTMHGVLPPEAVTLIATWLQALVQGPTEKHGIGLIVSILLALWSMWAASGMLITAVNVCYGEEETRGFVSFNLRALALGAGLALFGATALALFAVLPAALAMLPVTDPWHEVLGFLRWPILAVVAIVALAIVYRYAPDRAEPRWQWISWGAVVGDSALARGFDWIHGLRLQDRQLRQDIRVAWRSDHPAAVVLSDRLRRPRRGGTECRD